MYDHIEMGTIIQLADGWFIDKETNIRFRMDEDGNAIDEKGNPVFDEEDSE